MGLFSKQKPDEVVKLSRKNDILKEKNQFMENTIRDLMKDLNRANNACNALHKRIADYDGKIGQLRRIVFPVEEQRNFPEIYNKIYRLHQEDRIGELGEILIERTRYICREVKQLQYDNQQSVLRHDSDIQSLKDSHQRQLDGLSNDHYYRERDLKNEIEANEKRFSEQIRDRRTQHESDMSRLQQEKATADQEHRETLTCLQETHILREDELIKNHEAEVTQMKETHELTIAQMRSEHEAEVTQMEESHKSRVARMKADHEQATQRYRSDLEAHSEALVKRDKFTDLLRGEDIKAKFMDLVKLVDELADLDWKDDRTVWPSHMLRELSENQRLLKKYLIQDTIWIILFEYIFWSPFRIFGLEGEKLENLWAGRPVNDPQSDNLDQEVYSWPVPSMETERWRYVNVEECRNAASQKLVSDWDPRLRLKNGFASSSKKLNAELTAALSEMIYWNEDVDQRVKKMTKRMSKVWLEFGRQRCRILIIQKGSRRKLPIDKLDQLSESPLELGITPELVVYGNSKGLELETRETMSKGRVVTLSRKLQVVTPDTSWNQDYH